MKHTQRILMAEMLVGVVMSIALVALFELHVLVSGAWSDNAQAEFVVLSAMELLVLCAIPIALRLFKFGHVHRQLLASPAKGLLKWGTLRMAMLTVPMVLNTLLYYLFFMKAAFGYLAIILLICLGFVVPTMARCKSETGQ